MDEFEDVAFVARLPMTPTADGNANSRKRSAIAKVVSRIYRAANDALRADMSTRLLRPLAALSTAALVMLHRSSPERSALLSKTVSSLDTNVGNRRFERT